MAVAEAKCVCKTCGKTFTKTSVKRNRSQANSWEEWAEDHFDECDECKEARVAKEIAEENRINREFCEKLGLPDLVGTEKQIAYANTKRANWFRACFRSMRYEEHEYAEYAYDEPDEMEFNRKRLIRYCL